MGASWIDFSSIFIDFGLDLVILLGWFGVSWGSFWEALGSLGASRGLSWSFLGGFGASRIDFTCFLIEFSYFSTDFSNFPQRTPA